MLVASSSPVKLELQFFSSMKFHAKFKVALEKQFLPVIVAQNT